MSFIDLPGIEDVKEPQLAVEGLYDLIISDVKGKDKDGKQGLQVMMEIEGEGDYAPIFHHVALPSPDDDADKRKSKLLFAKRFLHQFGVPMSGTGFDIEQVVGCRASACRVTVDVYEGRKKNVLQVNSLPQEN